MDKRNVKKCPHNFECASKTVKPALLYHKENPLDAETQFYIHIIIISSVRTKRI